MEYYSSCEKKRDNVLIIQKKNCLLSSSFDHYLNHFHLMFVCLLLLYLLVRTRSTKQKFNVQFHREIICKELEWSVESRLSLHNHQNKFFFHTAHSLTNSILSSSLSFFPYLFPPCLSLMTQF
jgi:hypothetical protein